MQSIWIGNIPIQKLPSVTNNKSNALCTNSKVIAQVSGTCVSHDNCPAKTTSQSFRGQTRGDRLKNSPPNMTIFQSFLIRDQNKSCRSHFNFDNLESLKERLRAFYKHARGNGGRKENYS